MNSQTPNPDTAAPPAPERVGSRRRIALPLGVAALLALLAWGVIAWSHSLGTIGTDDAQVEGHVIPVLARVGGYTQQVNAHENQAVRQGDTLVVLDDRDLRVRLEQAEADLSVALAGSGVNGQAVAQLRAAHDLVSQAQADARKAASDLARARTLAGQNMISRQQLEAAEAASASADAALSAARARAIAADAQTRGAEGQALSERAARDQAALELSYTRIVAPRGGIVAKKGVEVGQLVQPGQPLLVVVPLDDVWVVANLKETQIKHLRPGDKVVFQADSYPGRRYRGHVESVSPATGAKFSLLPPDNATGNFVKIVQRVPVKIVLDGPNDPAYPLRPGMSVRVDIHTGG
ncbi:MAG TPA: HlyD family secretion protein [Candidatus Eisenbacteria bacterium]|nr:HlyD family secretion protein [Candidatus Eisenbacteria bacterium]